MKTLTIYSRPGCHLCDEMKSTVEGVIGRRDIVLHEIDISTDAELERQYGLEIPVLMLDGRKIAKYRIEAAALARMVV